MKIRTLIALSLAIGLGAPAIQAARAADPAIIYLPTTKLTLTAGGKPHVYTVEVAKTGEQQARGLMFRRKMAQNAGMIFPMVPPRPASFWMENTYLPLDIIFIGAGNEVLNITHGKPLSEDTLDSLGAATAVLELNEGEAKRIGLKAGDKVGYKLQ